jgi:integrase
VSAAPLIYYVTHPVTGHRHEIRCRTRRELRANKAHVAELRNAVRLGTKTPEQVSQTLRGLGRGGQITVSQAMEAYANSPRVSAVTRARVQTALRCMLELAPLPLAAVTRAPLTRWIESELQRGLAVASVRKQFDILSCAIRYAIDRGWLDSRPWGEWRYRWGPSQASVREACRTLSELVDLLSAARKLDKARERRGRGRLEAAIALAALLGLRQGELAGLRWGDCDEASGTVLIARQWGGAKLPKGRQVARLRAPRALWEVLARLRERTVLCPPAHWPIFPYKGQHRTCGQPLNTKALRRAVTLAGLPNARAWSGHSMRDTFVTLELIARRGDLAAVMARSRHASIKSALRYVHALHRDDAPAFELPELAPAAAALGVTTTDDARQVVHALELAP